ncbi:trypsin-like serine protease, partial [Kitasatospora sp. NPDC059973]|uniref:trypsin-like serine protease n=1 Tax=Kitasatospora sp. NPDC059973 TaxID=3347020 RepID=UPI0036A3FFD5
MATAITFLVAAPFAHAAPDPAANVGAPTISEGFSYPGADEVLAATGATLVRGDGGITYVPCDSPHQIAVWARGINLTLHRLCFAAPGAAGYLAVTIPDTFRLQTYGRDLHASLTTDGSSQPIDVPHDTFVGVGEGANANSHSVLLELRVTGSSTSPSGGQPTDPALAFAAKLNIGDGKRACSGTLVNRYWVLSAASCFTDNPSDLTTVTAGAPKDKTTATIGRTDLANTSAGKQTDIVELVPRTDRDLVMARLATPVDGITPVTVATSAPTTGEILRIAGYGRTKSEWVPAKLHTTTLTAGTIAATGLDVISPTNDTTLCEGDAGAPTLRDKNGTTELAAIASRSWQGNCLGTPATETRTGAYTTRTDDLAGWVQQVKASRPGSRVFAVGGDNKAWTNEGSYTTNVWGTFDSVPGANSVKQITSVNVNGTIRLFAIGTDNQ